MKHLIVVLLCLSLITAISAYEINQTVPTRNYALSIFLGKLDNMPIVDISDLSDAFSSAVANKMADLPVLGGFFKGLIAVTKIIVFVPVLAWNGINVVIWFLSGSADPDPSSVGGGGGGRGGR